jgi:hypothetical protein
MNKLLYSSDHLFQHVSVEDWTPLKSVLGGVRDVAFLHIPRLKRLKSHRVWNFHVILLFSCFRGIILFIFFSVSKISFIKHFFCYNNVFQPYTSMNLCLHLLSAYMSYILTSSSVGHSILIMKWKTDEKVTSVTPQ